MARPVKDIEIPKGTALTPELAFGIVVREQRLAKGLTQADLEDDEWMDRSYISKLELGKNQVTLRGILHIAERLGLSVGDLMAEVEKRMREHGNKG